MVSNDILYIVIPAYNEEVNICKVVKEWYSVVEKYGGEDSKLLVIDDGSTDSTYQLLKNLEGIEKYPKLTCVQKENSGHGATVLYGYKYAISHGASYIFQTDSDGQTLPGEFAAFWQERMNYDIIIGYRHHREDGWSRIVVTKTLKWVIRCCFGVNIKDANTPYRLMRADVLEKNIDAIPDGFNLTNVLLSVIYAKRDLAIKFIPITFRPRQGGTNSINLKRITKIGVAAIRDFWNLRKVI